MTVNKVPISLNKLQWSFLTNAVKAIADRAPIEGWEVESCVILECFKRHLQQFTFFPAGKDSVRLTLSYAEAFAINNFFSAHSSDYNTYLRMYIENKLPVSNE